MFGTHRIYGLGRIEIQTIGNKSFGGLTKLTLLGQTSGTTDIQHLLGF